LRSNGGAPHLFGVELPRARLEAVRVVDTSASDSWTELTATYRRTRTAHQEHEGAKADLKKLVPEDAKEAIGKGPILIRCRSHSGCGTRGLMAPPWPSLETVSEATVDNPGCITATRPPQRRGLSCRPGPFDRVGWAFTLAAAYNLVRLPKLIAEAG
jgi:hypothetical protein